MKQADIQELIMIVRSCKNNMNKKYEGMYDKAISERCNDFCRNHKIEITHGSAYKELRHKSYYYVNKCIDSIINNGKDKYGLYENNIISAKEIVDRLIKE